MVAFSLLLLAIGTAVSTAIVDAAAVVTKQPGKLVAKQVGDEVFEDKAIFCSHVGRETMEGSMKIWEDRGAYDFDFYITDLAPEGSKNWIKHLEQLIVPGANTGADTCAVISGPCDPLREQSFTCEDYFDLAGNNYMIKAAYWIFEAARGIHAKLSNLHTQLLDAAFLQSLEIQEMVDIFEETPEASDLLKWLSFSLSAATAALPYTGSLKDAMENTLGLLSYAVDSIPEEEVEKSAGTADLASMIRQHFNATGKAIERSLWLAMGASDNDDDYKELHSFRDYVPDNESNLSKFFSTGLWLTHLDEAGIAGALSQLAGQLRSQLADRALKQARWQLYVKNWRHDGAEDCVKRMGDRFITYRGKAYCMALARFDSFPIEGASEKVYNALAGYGISDLREYYISLLDCLWGSPRERKDWRDIVWIGNLPKCYYQVPVYYCENCSLHLWDEEGSLDQLDNF